MAFGRKKIDVVPAPVIRERTPRPAPDDVVPPGMRIAGAYSWRILALVGVIALFIWLLIQVSEIMIPFLIALVIAALLVPLSNWMQRHHVPKWAAIVISEIGVLAAVAALIWLVVDQVLAAYPSLQKRTVSQYSNVKDLVINSGLGITQKDINGWFSDGLTWLQHNSSSIASGVASAGSSATHVLEGLFVILFSTLFILIDGKTVWHWIVKLFPKKARNAVDGAGVAGWITLTSFVRVQIFVAFVDAVGVGIGAVALQLPLVIPIAVFVFLGAFIPVVGAIVTGFLAVFIALVFNGPLAAGIMLIVILIVQQLEGHVLQPLVMGNAVKVHPLAVVLGVTTASSIAGIPGAFFAVPLIATVNSMVTTIASGRWKEIDSDHVRDAKPKKDEAEVVPKNRFRRIRTPKYLRDE